MTEVKPRLLLSPDRQPLFQYLAELRGYWRTIGFLTFRDIKYRFGGYQGLVWSLLPPLCFTLVVHGFLYRGNASTTSSAASIFCGFLCWQFFNRALTVAANSVRGNSPLIRRLYFPRAFLPIALVLSGLVDFTLGAFTLGIWHWVAPLPSPHLWGMLACLPLLVAAGSGAGLCLACFDVRFYGTRYAIGFISQLWLLASPIWYSSQVVPEKWRMLHALNPLVGIIQGMQWSLVGEARPLPDIFAVSAAAALGLLGLGIVGFWWIEHTLGDRI